MMRLERTDTPEKTRDGLPIKLYRGRDRLMVAAPMPGLEPEDINVEIAADDRLILRGSLRSYFKEEHEVLLDEWQAGGFTREVALPCPVDGSIANVTYGNGVVVIALPVARQTHPAYLTLDHIGATRGERAGHEGYPSRAVDPANARPSAGSEPVDGPEGEGRAAGDGKLDVVDEASDQSFPASDPPGWVGGPAN